MTGRFIAAAQVAQGLATPGTEPPGSFTVATAGLIAAGLAVIAWPVAGHAITIAHEGGHALTTILRGHDVIHVKLNRDRTGETLSSVGSLLTTFVGYAAPSMFGLLGALTLANGQVDAVLWVTVVLLALMLISMRTWFGLFSVIVTGTILTLAARSAVPWLHSFVACTWVWFLLFGGLARLVEVGNRSGDHDDLFKKTWIPRTIWAGLHLLGAIVALLLGAGLLVGIIGQS